MPLDTQSEDESQYRNPPRPPSVVRDEMIACGVIRPGVRVRGPNSGDPTPRRESEAPCLYLREGERQRFETSARTGPRWLAEPFERR